MRASIVLAAGSALLAAIAACAASENEAQPKAAPPPDTLLDGGAPDGDVADVDVPDTRLPDCSGAGWCITPFPDEDLVFRDIWPFEDVAFAIADSRMEGVKFLEWTKSTNAWAYIDDNSQNSAGVGTFAGGVYAPTVDEVYFTVGASSVFHAKRPAPPETKWTWKRQELPDNIIGHPKSHDHGRPFYNAPREPRVAFGVWGTGVDNVYAHFSNTIFRRDPAADAWSAVYTIDDLDPDTQQLYPEHAFFVSVSGTGPDDIWFVGGRDRTYFGCPLVVRKTAQGFTRVVDAVVRPDVFGPCSERAGTLLVGGSQGGWISDIQPVSSTEYIALHDGMNMGFFDKVNLTQLREGDGGYSFEQSVVPVKFAQAAPPQLLSSLWRGSQETWFTSFGLILHSSDHDTYSVSTISRDGAPVNAPLFKIRGTSDQNLWAIGAQHAYHKTTP